MNRDKNTKSHIDSFRIGDESFHHYIFCADDDRVELQDDTGKVFLTYTANCQVMYEGKQIARISMDDNYHWKFYDMRDNIIFGKLNPTNDLIMLEVKFSQYYLGCVLGD